MTRPAGPLAKLWRMTGSAAQPAVQLLLYDFGPDADFEGRLVGALGRLESGGAIKILDALFVHRDKETGELEIVSLEGDGAGGITGPLNEFRLDPRTRRRETEKALAGRPGGIPPDLLKDLGETLRAGDALAAVLVDHVWRRTLDDAVDRSNGTPVVDRFVDVGKLTELAPELLAARS